VSKPEVRRTLEALKRCNWNQSQAARELGIGRETLRSRIAGLRLKGHKIETFRPAPAQASESLTDKLKEAESKIALLEKTLEARESARAFQAPRPARIKREKEDRVIAVFPDVHGAHQSKSAVSAFLAALKAIDPDGVVGLGDLTDCAGFMAQHHVLAFVAQTLYSFEEDLTASGLFLDAVQSAAPRAWLKLLQGNHDLRPETWSVTSALRNRVDAEFLRKLVDPSEVLKFKARGIEYYRRSEKYDGTTINGAAKIGHLIFAHGVLGGGGDPEKVLNAFGCNVVYGHTHRMAMAMRPQEGNKSIGAWNIGHLAEPRPLYAHGSPTKWTHGFGVAVFSRSGLFQMIPVPIINGVSLWPRGTVTQ
jgi:hypothetical protein